MAKAEEFIRDAYEETVSVGADAPLTSVDAQKGLRYLNDLLFEWEAMGISLGFTEVDNLADDVTIPRSSFRAVKLNLAMQLAPAFDRVLNPATVVNARDAKQNLLAQTISIVSAGYPDTLPVGSGNTCGDVYDRRFYTEVDGTLERESGGSILTEDGTE